MTGRATNKYEPLIGQARLAKRMRKEMQCDPQWVLDLAAERDQLRAEVEALRKDAGKITDRMIAAACDVCVGFGGEYGEYNEYLSKDAAREVLEAALAAKEGA